MHVTAGGGMERDTPAASCKVGLGHSLNINEPARVTHSSPTADTHEIMHTASGGGWPGILPE